MANLAVEIGGGGLHHPQLALGLPARHVLIVWEAGFEVVLMRLQLHSGFDILLTSSLVRW